MAKEELRFLFPLVLVGAAALAAIILMLGYGPPRLPFDGQGSVTGTAYTGIGQLPPKFSPPWNVFTDEPFLSVDTRAVTGGKVNVTVSAEQSGMIFYKQFYVYQNVSGNYWLAYNFPDTPISGSKWIADGAAATVTMDASKLSAENYVLVYACTRDASNRWRCGCRSDIDTKCLNWSIQNYSLPVTTPPQYVCTGTPSPNATLCTGDDAGLAQDTAVSLVAACTAAKCEHTCNAPSYFLNGTKCSLNTSSCDITTCPGRTAGQNFCGADLTKIYVCTAASAGCLILNVNACGASASCQNSTGTALCLSCAATAPVASSIACGQNATGVLCSNNQPYRVNGTNCTAVGGTCQQTTSPWSCGSGPQCTSASQCDDSNPCTTDGCTGGSCTHTALNSGACTTSDGKAGTCSAGQCVATCTDQCNPTQYPKCGCCSPTYYYEACVKQTNGCYALKSTSCSGGQLCDTAKGGCYTAANADTDAATCLATTDMTPKTSNPPTQYAGDYGINYIDPWPTGAEGTGKCCGNTVGEYWLYSEGDKLYTSCCNNVNDCIDTSGKCYTHNQTPVTVTTGAGTSNQFCWYDWWYKCDSTSVCLAHKSSAATSYECYNQSGVYKWLPYTNTETCGDGIDNNCDGQIDENCPCTTTNGEPGTTCNGQCLKNWACNNAYCDTLPNICSGGKLICTQKPACTDTCTQTSNCPVGYTCKNTGDGMRCRVPSQGEQCVMVTKLVGYWCNNVCQAQPCSATA